MLRRDHVGGGNAVVYRIAQQNRAVIVDRPARDFGTAECGQLFRQFLLNFLGKAFTVGNQHCLSQRVVLGLTEHIGGHIVGGRAVVGHYQHLAGASYHVYAYISVYLALGIGHEYVAGAGDLVHARDGFGAECRRRDCLRAAHAVYLGRARLARRYQRQRVYAAVLHRRGKHRYALYARDGCGDYVH